MLCPGVPPPDLHRWAPQPHLKQDPTPLCSVSLLDSARTSTGNQFPSTGRGGWDPTAWDPLSQAALGWERLCAPSCLLGGLLGGSTRLNTWGRGSLAVCWSLWCPTRTLLVRNVHFHGSKAPGSLQIFICKHGSSGVPGGQALTNSDRREGGIQRGPAQLQGQEPRPGRWQLWPASSGPQGGCHLLGVGPGCWVGPSTLVSWPCLL